MDTSTIYPAFIREILNFYHSGTFAVIKFIIAVYVAILVVDIVLLIIQRNIFGNIRQIMYGVNMPPELNTKKAKLREHWSKIRHRLGSENPSEYKVAVIEADNIIDDLIRRLGYKGENMAERIGNIPAGQIDRKDEIMEAHEIRNRIIHEENFQLSREEAAEILGKYEHFLKHFEVLD